MANQLTTLRDWNTARMTIQPDNAKKRLGRTPRRSDAVFCSTTAPKTFNRLSVARIAAATSRTTHTRHALGRENCCPSRLSGGASRGSSTTPSLVGGGSRDWVISVEWMLTCSMDEMVSRSEEDFILSLQFIRVNRRKIKTAHLLTKIVPRATGSFILAGPRNALDVWVETDY